MKTSIRIAGVVAGLALLGAPSAQAGITNSFHDLSYDSTSASSADLNASGSSRELCAFCHTPHAANTAFSGAPIWNKATPSGAFTLYGDTVALTATEATVQSQSMACLSCHDGVSAINSIVNAPGSGGLTDGTDFTVTGDMWANTALDSDGFTMADLNASSYGSAATGVRIIGTDLTNDHPVSIQYLGDGTATSPASLKDPSAALVGWKTPSGTLNIDAVLKDNGLANKTVECGTCHDPHFTDNGRFLRASNDQSALCISCHEK